MANKPTRRQHAGRSAPSGPKGRPTPGRRDRQTTARQLEARRRLRTRVGVIALGVSIVAGVAAFAVSSSHAGGTGKTDPTAFNLPRLGRPGRIRLADFRGEPTVVNFFASWCTACDFELPGFQHVSQETKGRVHFVGVDSLETGDPMFMPRRHGLTWWPLAKDVGGANGSGLHDALGGGNSMPLTAFYDADGHLLEVERAALPESTLRGKVQQFYGIQT